MLNWGKERPWLSALLAVATLFIIFFVVSLFVPIYGDFCSYNEHARTTDCANYQIGPFALLWTAEIIDQHNGFVTAIATFAIAAFTFTLYKTSRDQGDIALKSIDLARQEFIATHRPRVIVRSIQGPSIDEASHEIVWVTLVNIGETNATIVALGRALHRRIGPNGWLPPGLSGVDPRPFPHAVLASGERIVIDARAGKPAGDEEIFLDATTDAELCAIGRVSYRDDNGRLLEMGFLRVHDGKGNFLPSGNPEDEYQD